MPSLSLLGAVLALAVWVLFTFVLPAGLGVVHLLLAAGVVLVMRWWTTREGEKARVVPPSRPSRPSRPS